MAPSLEAGGRAGVAGRSAALVRSGRAVSKSSVSTAAWLGLGLGYGLVLGLG